MESNVGELAIHERLLAWFETHRKETLWTVILVGVAGLGTGLFIWHQGQREADANAALAKITGPAFTNPDLDPAPESLLQIAANFPHTDAGGRAQLLAAAALYSRAKYPEARLQFERYLREYHDSPMSGQAIYGVAACLDAEGKTTEAITAYSDLVQHHPGENSVPSARAAIGRLYESQGKLAQARDIYIELARSSAYGSLSTAAALRLQNLFLSHPELVLAATQTPPKEGTIKQFGH